MIHYDLRCAAGHAFDGWFRDSRAFDAQVKAGLLGCPTCGSTDVGKRLMAPAVARAPGVKGRADRVPDAATPTSPAGVPARVEPPPQHRVAGGPMPAQLVALLQRARAEVEARCDDVGTGFAEEARRLHRGERESDRGIYGQTTAAEAEALAEEGIEVGRIPWVPRADG